MPTKTKKTQVDLAQELGIVEEQQPEISSHVQKLLNRKTRNQQQAFSDWRGLCEAQINREFIPETLVQETFDLINDNPRLADGYTALLNDARDLQTYRRGQRNKKIDQRSQFVERHGDRPSLVAKLQAMKTEMAELKSLLREYDRISSVNHLTSGRADQILVTNHRLFPQN